MSCNHVFTNSLQLLYAPLFSLGMPDLFLAEYLSHGAAWHMAAPDSGSDMLRKNNSFSNDQYKWLERLCMCWAVIRAFTVNPTGLEHIQSLLSISWLCLGGLEVWWFGNGGPTVHMLYMIKSYDVEISGNKFGTFALCFPRGIYKDWINVLKTVFSNFWELWNRRGRSFLFLLWKYV